jgi:hypothetical protein
MEALMATKTIEPLIKMIFYNPCTYTDEEFEKMAKQIWARLMSGCPEEGDRALCQLISGHVGRYHEVCLKKGRTPDPLVLEMAKAYENKRRRISGGRS